MFRIHSILMANFAYFESTAVPLHGETSVFTGGNATGKSSTLDAARLVLGTKKLSKENRVLGEYLRNKHTYTVIAVVAHNRRRDGKMGIFSRLGKKAELVTLARVFVPQADGFTSRYVMADGALQVNEVLDRIEKSGQFDTEKPYLERLAGIGVTPALLDQIIIRQSKVTEVVHLKPRDLYHKVLEHAGSNQVVADYAAAYDDVKRAQEKLRERRREFELAEDQGRTYRADVRVLDDHDEKIAKATDLEWEVRAAKTHTLLRRRASLAEEIGKLDEQIPSLKEDHAELTTSIEEQVPAVQKLEAVTGNWDAEVKNLEGTVAKLKKESEGYEELRGRAAFAKTELARLKNLPPTDALVREASTAGESLAGHERQAARSKVELTEVDAYVADMEAGRMPVPPAMASTLQELEKAGIAYEVLARLVDPPMDRKAQIEGALGARRYAIGVAPDRLQAALQIGKRVGHPGPIYARDAQRTGTTSASAIGHTKAPSWLEAVRMDRDVVTTPEGVWTSRATILALGGKPSRGDLDHARAEQRRLQQSLRPMDALEGQAREGADKAAERVREGRARDSHEKQLRDAAGVLARDQQVRDELLKAEVELRRMQAGPDEDKKKLKRARELLKRDKEQVGKLAASLFQKEEAAKKSREELATTEAELKDAITPLPEAWRKRAEDPSDVLGAPGRLEEKANQLRKEAGAMKLPDPKVRELQKRHETQLGKFKERVDDQQKVLDKTHNELVEVRKKYAIFAVAHLKTYEARLRRVSADFDVAVSVSFPAIREDSSDADIENAYLEVSFSYDGKAFALVSSGGFSGGQEVINALTLQLALQEVNEDGFIMVDQPYDNLDDRHALEVAKHLSHAKMQVIIVVPSTMNPTHYHGMVRGILFHPARDGAAWAPAPEVVALRA